MARPQWGVLRFRSSRSIWQVRLAFFGDAFEVAEGPVGGGFIVLTVRAIDEREARRKAIEVGKAEVAKLNQEVNPFWSTESVESVKKEITLELHLFADDSPVGPAPLAELVAELSSEDLRLRIGRSELTVVAELPESFSVRIRYEEMQYEVSALNWHCHYDDAEQAISCFRWLLTPFYRVGLDIEDEKVAAAWVERYAVGGWEALDPVLFRNPTDPTQWMSQRWTREYWQQALQTPPMPYDEIEPGAELGRDGYPSGAVLGTSRYRFKRPLAEELGWLDREYTFDPGTGEPPKGLE